MKKICVCVCTRNRPAMLSNCLASISPRRQLSVSDDIEIQYVVVDNAPNRQTNAIVERTLPGAVYVAEHRPGLSPARNAALATALELDADWIAFIDDDEVAAPDWLQSLHGQAIKFRADAVHGAIRYRWPSDAPAWRRKAPWSDWADHDGAPLNSAGTGNVLFKTDIVRFNRLGFDSAHSLMGGEDAFFFRRYHELGGNIVFSSKPKVFESVPWSRITLRGFARKAHRNGALKVEQAKLNKKFKRRRFLRKAASRFTTGLLRVALTPIAALGGRALPVLSSGINDIAEGAGIIRAIRGDLPAYYAKTDGY